MREISIMLLVLLTFVITIFLGNEKQIQYLIDLSGAIIALVGILLTIPILRKKFIESHISKALIDIQDANKKLFLASTDLNDEYYTKEQFNEIVKKEELNSIFEQIKSLYKISQEANRDSQTMLYFLKATLQNMQSYYTDENPDRLFTSDIYSLVGHVLRFVEFSCTQVVQIPKSTKMIKDELINPRYKKLVTNSNFVRYKYFKQGVIYDPNSAHYLRYYEWANNRSNILIKESTFQIFMNSAPIKKLFWINNIYAPFEFAFNQSDPLLNREKLYLIAYRTIEKYNPGKENEVWIEVIYSTAVRYVDFSSFYNSLEQLKTHYYDDTLDNFDFSLDEATSFTMLNRQSFSMKFKYEYLQSIFKKNKSLIRKVLIH